MHLELTVGDFVLPPHSPREDGGAAAEAKQMMNKYDPND